MDWRLGDELGHGALGRVVEVYGGDGSLRAGKILHESNRDDPRARERFRREAQLMASVEHVNLARVHGIEVIDGLEVLLMEKIDGPSLARLLAELGKLSEDRIGAIGRGIAAGLAAAHRAGLVHRDLKPANVLIAAGDTAKIVDFGLARATSFAGVDRKSFALVGTPDYMAPESIDPLAVDPRSDLYSLGCILYEMATGLPPYGGATPFAVLEAHLRVPLPPISGRFAELVRALLAKSPADRPQSAAAVEARLAGALIPAELARASGCAHCGAALVAEVPVCFACARPQLAWESGPMTVFVTGPGKVSHKLDGALRLKLLEWLERSPGLGLDAGQLAKEVPRLPFVLAEKVAERAAERLCSAARGLGLELTALRGGVWSLPQMREKRRAMAGRAIVVSLGSMAGAMNVAGRHLPVLFIGLALMPIVGWSMGHRLARKSPTKRAFLAETTLPKALAAPAARVADVVPAIEAPRHREGLRAVVQRLFALRAAAGGAGLDEELAQVLDLATLATVRLDELERRLAAADLRDSDDATRKALRERDAWAARLLDATAQLDALRARLAAGLARGVVAGAGETLDELRAQVAAFEEIQKAVE